MKTCKIICNKHSGKGIKDTEIVRILNVLEEYNYLGEFIYTKGHKDATEIIKNMEYVDLVISIGGDGTFSEVIQGNIERKEPLLLSHLPHGTTNDVAKNYGLNKSLITNLKNILEGKVVEIDVPTINNIPFIYVSGYGKFLNIPYEVPQKLKKKIGYFAYLYYGAKDFIKKLHAYEVKYKIDGKEYRGKFSMFIISNSTNIAGFKHFYKSVDLADGKVEVAMLQSTKRIDLLKAMIGIVTSGAESVKSATRYSCYKVELTFKEKLHKKWCIDGDRLDLESRKYVIEVKNKISLLVPKTMNVKIK